MTRFVLRRVVSAAIVLFAVSVMTFLVFNVIPNGDPAQRMAPRGADERQVQSIREEWGFDEPVYEQYLSTMGKLFSADIESYETGLNVVDQVWSGAPRTFSLAIGAALLWMAAAVALGLYGAMRAGRFSDFALTALALVGISMPVFWVGALMNHYVGFKLGLFPNGGYVELTENPLDWAYHLVMPWTALALLFIGIYSRVLRSNLLDTMGEDYVRTARAKGLSERQVLLRHVLRNSLIPVTTLWGLDFAALLGGAAILTEAVFDLQGIGQYTADAIGDLDQPVVMTVTLLGAFFIVVVNAVVDVIYAALDPRIRVE